MRLLCLHGYQGSADVLRRQLRPLAGSLDTAAEFVALDAPSIAEGDFGWWHGNPPGSDRPYRGWARTRDWLLETFEKQGPFDGVFGFSQGAALTALVPGLFATEHRALPRFVIMTGGFSSKATEHEPLFAQREAYRIPSCHLIGETDAVVAAVDSLALAAEFDSPTVLRHPGGHVIPATPEIGRELSGFLAKFG